jgi:hypothetical protein
MTAIRSSILTELGLPLSAHEVPDTKEGGAAAMRAQISWSALLRARKYVAAQAWLNKAAALSGQPGKPRRSPSDIAKLIKLWNQGYSVTELMVVFDVYSTSAITSLLLRHGVKLPPTPFRRWRKEEDSTMREFAAEGSSCEEIAAVFKRTPYSVAGRARKLNLPEVYKPWERSYRLGRKQA